MPATLEDSYDTLLAAFPDLPASPIIRRAYGHARQQMPDFLFNHVARSWIFAAKIGARGGDRFDADVVGVSTLLHDIGMTAHGDGPYRFEVNGAEVARGFVRDLGLTIGVRSLCGMQWRST
jgi:HD superfamily phosphodiesterase